MAIHAKVLLVLSTEPTTALNVHAPMVLQKILPCAMSMASTAFRVQLGMGATRTTRARQLARQASTMWEETTILVSCVQAADIR